MLGIRSKPFNVGGDQAKYIKGNRRKGKEGTTANHFSKCILVRWF